MAIETECSGCGVQLRVADEHAGRQARCPKCGNLYTVPDRPTASSPSPTSSAPPPPPGSNEPPNQWYMRTPEGESYGPVDRGTLDGWIAQERITAHCEIRESNSPHWKSAAAVFPHLAATVASANPYAETPKSSNPYQAPRTESRRYREPHRGALILIFGILGFLVCVLFSPAAWIMGNADLKKMDAGVMDPEGRTLTQVGMILGIIQSCLMILGLVIFFLWILLAVGAGMAGM